MTVGADIIKGHGYATYRLNILIPSGLKQLSLKIQDFGTSGRLFIDGELMLQMGHPGTTAKASEGQYKPTLINFAPRGQRTELVFHIANFDHRKGGYGNQSLLAHHETFNGSPIKK